MTAAPQSVPPTATIAEAAGLMREHDIGDVVVIEDGTDRIIGIVTDRDVAVRGVGAATIPGQRASGRSAALRSPPCGPTRP